MKELGRVVDEERDRPDGRRRGWHEALDLLGIAEIGGDDARTAAAGHDLRRYLVGSLARGVAVDGDGVAGLGQRESDGAPDAPRRARHQGCTPSAGRAGSDHACHRADSRRRSMCLATLSQRK